MVGAPQVMVLIQAVSQVFRAVVAASMGISSMLASTAIGGVLRSSMSRMLGFGDCTTTIPVYSGTAASRITVCQFVASGIKYCTIWLSSFSEEEPG